MMMDVARVKCDVSMKFYMHILTPLCMYLIKQNLYSTKPQINLISAVKTNQLHVNKTGQKCHRLTTWSIALLCQAEVHMRYKLRRVCVTAGFKAADVALCDAVTQCLF